jgi:hypothetical protein
MGWPYQTYQIPCEKGGLNGSKNFDAQPPEAMLWPTRNINLNQGGRSPRGGTVHVDTAATSGVTEGRGLYDFTKESGTQSIIRAWSSGQVFSDDKTEIASGMSKTNYFHFAGGNDVLYIADGTNIPRTWTGTGDAVTVSASASSWTTNAPMQMIVHGRGASERMWAICKDGVYASSGTDMLDFSDANSIFIGVDTGDGFGLVGGIEYGDQLFVFGKNKFFAIDDSSTTTSEWGYKKAAWEGGAAHWRVVTRYPKGLVAMAEDGEIYLVTSVADYGDYKSASLIRPAYIDEWIRTYADLSNIDDFHAVHSPDIRAVKFFVRRQGFPVVTTALVYFYDRDPSEAWAIHDGSTAGSGYNASTSALVRKSTGTWKVYTQDYDAMVWELESSTKADNGVGYYKGFTTSYNACDNSRQSKLFRRGWLTFIPKGNYALNVRPIVDGAPLDTQEVSMGSSSSVLGSFMLGTDRLGRESLSEAPFDIGDIGERVQYEIWDAVAGQDFFISTIKTDFKVLSARNVD